MQLQIGTVPFVLELGPSSPHKEYLPSSDNCVEMSGGNVLKTKGNFHMGTQTHCLYVCANVHFMKLSGLFFLLEPWPRRKNTRSIVGGHHNSQCILSNSCPKTLLMSPFRNTDFDKSSVVFFKNDTYVHNFSNALNVHQDLHSRA